MKFGISKPTRAFAGKTCAVALAASATLASFEASAASIVLNEPADGSTVNVYTPGGTLPASLNAPTSATAGLDTIAVTFGIQGGSMVNEGETSDGVNWTGVVDLTDGANSASYTTTVEAIAESEGYYNNNADFASDTADVTVNVFDSSAVDSDGDGTPDADSLTGAGGIVPTAGDTATIQGTGESGDPVETSVGNISGAGRTTISAVVMIDGYYGDGATANIEVSAPSLADLQAALPGNASVQGALSAVVLVTFASNSGDLTTDSGDDPASSLSGALGAFMRPVILLEIAADTWVSLMEPLPAGTELTATVSLTGVDGNVTRVRQFAFGLTFNQNGNNFEFFNGGGDWMKTEDTNDAPTGASRAISVDGSTVETDVATPGYLIAWVLTAGGGGGNDDDDGDTCFIATAAYGTPMSQEINTLREVRDSYLLNNVLGSAFVDTYYRLSPAVADRVAQSPALAAVVRAALTPFILLGNLILAAPMAVAALALAGAGLVVAHRRTRGQQS